MAYMVVLLVSLCIAHHKRNWFIVDSARPNPYKLVYSVTKFSHQHKVPVHRSAFTFCEDEVPSGLDLGKDKYGGPFTTEQVEDVKAFYGILKVLFALSPVFVFNIAADPLLYLYAAHGSQYNATLSGVGHNHEAIEHYFLQNGLLSPLLKVFGIPFYLCLLRPFISRYIPGMLKRMGIGITLVVASLICTFLMDTAAHAQEKNAKMQTSVCFRMSHITSSILLLQQHYMLHSRTHQHLLFSIVWVLFPTCSFTSLSMSLSAPRALTP